MAWDQLRLEALEDLSGGSWNTEEEIGYQDISELELAELDDRSDMGFEADWHSGMRVT